MTGRRPISLDDRYLLPCPNLAHLHAQCVERPVGAAQQCFLEAYQVSTILVPLVRFRLPHSSASDEAFGSKVSSQALPGGRIPLYCHVRSDIEVMGNSTHYVPIVRPPPGVQSNWVNPEGMRNWMIATHTICLFLVSVFMIMRLYTRKVVAGKLALDDCLSPFPRILETPSLTVRRLLYTVLCKFYRYHLSV